MKKIKRNWQRKGGQAVIARKPPDECPRCGESMQGRVYHSYLGHLGLHGLADKYFDGSIEAAQKRLRENGRARSDSFRANGAWQPYRPIPVAMEIGGEAMVRP
jgi:hypothetical protein